MSELFMTIPILLPIALGTASYFIPFKSLSARNIYTLITLTVSACFVWLVCVFTPESPLVMLEFTDNLALTLKLDGAGKLFSCLSATLWPLTALYMFSYMKNEKNINMFYTFFTLAFSATIGIAMSGNMLTMYLFYELLTLFTIPLVMHGAGHEHNAAARKYMVYSIGGAAFAFATVAFLIVSDANDFVFGGNILNTSNPEFARVLYLFAFLGFGVKAAIFPFHSWLPTASIAPTPVTALLHAVAVVKAGAFALIRLTFYSYSPEFLKGSWVQNTVMTICIITILFGSVFALKQPHFKRRLAYSTVSNMSYITFCVTLMSNTGLVAAFIQLIFHSIIKIGAFFATGAILKKSKRQYVSEFNGLGRKMPLTFTCLAVFSLSLTGIPLFCGFISKWYIATASIESNNTLAVIGVAILLISALLTAIYMLTPVIKAFFGSTTRPIITDINEADWLMQVPMWICVIACVLFGVAAWLPISVIEGVLAL